ncbi:MAG: SDR family oxidoreductase [Betaproteobacteria bacterium]|nr:SDR family oxidoreductase [Betaproteobacteria bacterium]
MKATELFDVQGLAVVITGGASGIGLACAEVLAANGARLALFDSNAETLAQAVRRLSGEGAVARGECVDVTNRAALETAFESNCSAFGRIDVVFANAGIGGGPGFLAGDGTRNLQRRIEDIPPEQWQRVMEVNLNGLFWTIQSAVRQMKKHGGGRIIVTSSVSSFKTEQHVGMPYVVSKAGVAHLVRQSALELAGCNITVNAIAPGPFITNISGGRLKEPDARAPFERATPMHRLGEAADIQGLALFLASPAARYLTGAQVCVDGGFSLGRAD